MKKIFILLILLILVSWMVSAFTLIDKKVTINNLGYTYGKFSKNSYYVKLEHPDYLPEPAVCYGGDYNYLKDGSMVIFKEVRFIGSSLTTASSSPTILAKFAVLEDLFSLKKLGINGKNYSITLKPGESKIIEKITGKVEIKLETLKVPHTFNENDSTFFKSGLINVSAYDSGWDIWMLLTLNQYLEDEFKMYYENVLFYKPLETYVILKITELN